MKARILRILSVAVIVVLAGTLVMFALPAQPASAERPDGERIREMIQAILAGTDFGAGFRNEATLPVTVTGFPPGTNVARYEQHLTDIGIGPDGVPKGVFEGSEPAATDNKPMQIFVPSAKMTMIYAWDPQTGYKFIDMVMPMFFKTNKIWVDYNKPGETLKWELESAKTTATQTEDYALMLTVNQVEQQLKNLGYQTGMTMADLAANRQAAIEAAMPAGLAEAASALSTASAQLNEAASQLKGEIESQIKSNAGSKLQSMDGSQLSASAKQLQDAAARLEELTATLKTLRTSASE